ncbi:MULTISPECIES: terminase small subunit protein [unclassified Bradyrhizobium]|uniref:terminase small subunit-like protein n=1 Tax=unclassified Bradyrhizobium TaxID=2631580 RepID=UPI0029163446|nr:MULTISPECIES: terminase small subunit protein [unclassified Bradyrhizobium]
MARPSDYNDEIAALILGRMAEGESLRAICRDEAMPAASTVFLWLSKHKAFSEQYARAAELRAHAFAEDIIEISDDGTNDTTADGEGRTIVNHDVIARSRLRVDTRKWLMARMAPKKYGDKIETTLQGGDKPIEQKVTVFELVPFSVAK